MNEKLVNAIYQNTKDLKDPITNNVWYKNSKTINIVSKDGNVSITIDINQKDSIHYADFISKLKKRVQDIENTKSVNIVLTSEINQNLNGIKEKKFNINSKHIIAIASGKGGVGKSTFAVNIAVALKKIGNNVGILDADIYGPSVPRMMGISRRPQSNENKKLIPLENYGIKCMSIGFLISVDTPAIWRGPMIMKALEQMFNGGEWGELDYLISDLPPGTGDAQLTLAQSSKLSGSIIISTPQDVALIDARKGINMFNKVKVPVLGIVENMSYFICTSCNQRHEIFSSGGVKKESEKNKIPFLGELPIDIDLRIQSDEGTPACISNPKSKISEIYISIAKKIHNIVN